MQLYNISCSFHKTGMFRWRRMQNEKKTMRDVENPSIVTVREVTSHHQYTTASQRDRLSFAAALREMRLNTSMQSISSNYQRSNLSSGNRKCICRQQHPASASSQHPPYSNDAVILLARALSHIVKECVCVCSHSQHTAESTTQEEVADYRLT